MGVCFLGRDIGSVPVIRPVLSILLMLSTTHSTLIHSLNTYTTPKFAFSNACTCMPIDATLSVAEPEQKK